MGLWVSKSSDATTGGVADGIGGLGCGDGWKRAMMVGAGVQPWCKEKEKEMGMVELGGPGSGWSRARHRKAPMREEWGCRVGELSQRE